MNQLRKHKQISINGIRRTVLGTVGPKVLVKIGAQRVWVEVPRVAANAPRVLNHGVAVVHGLD